MMNLANDRGKIDALLEKLPEVFNPEESKALTPDFCLSSGLEAA